MHKFLLLLVLVGLSWAEKERANDQSLDQLTSKLWHEIEKRLQDYDDGSDLKQNTEVDDDFDSQLAKASSGGTSQPKCQYESSNGSIVRTHDSLENGAVFINSLDSDTDGDLTRQSCLESCCDLDNCNLAVYKDKGDSHSCYMFDCGAPSVCKFTSHPGFSVHLLPSRNTGNKEQEKHADELAGLVVSTSTIATTTTTTTTTPAPPVVNKQPVGLFGVCEDHKDCAGSYTECLAGYCLCQEGYHAQDATCKPKTSGGLSKTDPKTLGGEGDSSDPAVSPDKGEYKWLSNKEPSQAKKPQVSVVESKKPPANTLPSLDQDVDHTDTRGPANPARPEIEMPPQVSSNPEPQAPRIIDNGGIAAPNTAEKKDPLKDTETVVEVVEEQDSASDPLPQGLERASISEGEGEEEEVFMAVSSQGAVVALALGLAVTALLLVFVGCRLRNMKKRLRKGRPLNSNEADYLINGMYL